MFGLSLGHTFHLRCRFGLTVVAENDEERMIPWRERTKNSN